MLVLVMDGAGGWMNCGGTPPRRPGRGGRRRWRRSGEGERDGDVARPDGEWRQSRDFDPLPDLQTLHISPPPSLLSSQEGPLTSLASPLVTSFHLTQVSSSFSSFLHSSR